MPPKAKPKMFPEVPSQGSRGEILPLIPFLEAASDPLTCVASKIRGKAARKHVTDRGRCLRHSEEADGSGSELV